MDKKEKRGGSAPLSVYDPHKRPYERRQVCRYLSELEAEAEERTHNKGGTHGDGNLTRSCGSGERTAPVIKAVEKGRAQSILKGVLRCKRCGDLDTTGALCIRQKEIGLNYTFPGHTPIAILFVAESPPKPGNGFFYDQKTRNPLFRKRLFKLINAARLGPVNSVTDFTEKGYYLTNAIQCRWDKSRRRDLPSQVFTNCIQHLEEQIRLFRPQGVVAMGNKARAALQSPPVERAMKDIRISKKNIISMSFILVARNQTDIERVEKLAFLCKRLRRQGIPGRCDLCRP